MCRNQHACRKAGRILWDCSQAHEIMTDLLRKASVFHTLAGMRPTSAHILTPYPFALDISE